MKVLTQSGSLLNLDSPYFLLLCPIFESETSTSVEARFMTLQGSTISYRVKECPTRDKAKEVIRQILSAMKNQEPSFEA